MRKSIKTLLSMMAVVTAALSLTGCGLMKKSMSSTSSSSGQPRKGVTLENFNRIKVSPKNGDKLSEVENLMGEEATEYAKEKGKTSYSWNDVKGGEKTFNELNVEFHHKRAYEKALYGMKVDRPKILTKTDYQKIKKGMSKTQVQKILGLPNDYFVTKESGYGLYENWTYDAKGIKGGKHSSIDITFLNGKVDDKDSMKLG